MKTLMKDGTRPQPNTKYLGSVADHLKLTGPKRRPTPGVPTHRATMDATLILTNDEATVYRSCVGALMYHVLARADACIMYHLRTPTTGAMEALGRVTRYLLGTQDTNIMLTAQSGDPFWMEMVVYSDSDWASDPACKFQVTIKFAQRVDGCVEPRKIHTCLSLSRGM